MLQGRIGQGLASPWLWVTLGLCFLVASRLVDTAPRSPFAAVEYALHALMIGLMAWRGPAGLGLRLPRRAAPLAYIALSWSFGMLYETTLTVDGTGIGGIHPDSRASFILGQGDYLMIATAGWLLIRHWHLAFADMVMVAGGKSLTEGLIFTGVLTSVLLSPLLPTAPFFLGYYTLVYALFVALPLLIIAPDSLWSLRTPAARPSAAMLWLIGFAVALAIRIIWGLGWAPFATCLFDLPPNLPTL